jgi:predicted LPLAT superfamily acyltransferase
MTKWDGKTKGTLLGYRILLFCVRHSPLSLVYQLLRFISLYFFCFSGDARRALRQFYSAGLGVNGAANYRLIYRNFYSFAQTLIDRLAFLVGKETAFTLSFEHEDYLIQMREAGRGGILLSGHVGNWETAGNLLKGRVTPTINVVMLDSEVEEIKDYLNDQTGGSKFRIIAIKEDLSHVLKINTALKNNEFVAIHADRYLEGAKSISLPFLGKRANFPLGPFLIASKFSAPVTFVFGVKKSNFVYHLSATLPITASVTPEEVARAFVAELEFRLKENPEQWFNYFPYFDDHVSA